MPKSTADPKYQDYELGLFALFKGESSSGKSVAALSFPNPYVLDLDVKMPSIAVKHFPGKEVHWDTFSNMVELGERLDKLQDKCPYETVILDTITGLTQNIIHSVGLIKGETVPVMLQKVKATKGGGKMIEMMGYDYYNAETRYVKYVLDVLKYLWMKEGNPRHVIVCGHVLDKEKTESDGSVSKTRTIVTAGKAVAAYIPTVFDETYHFECRKILQNVKFMARTQGTGDDFAKTTFHLPNEIDFTGQQHFYDQIKGLLRISAKKSPLLGD